MRRRHYPADVSGSANAHANNSGPNPQTTSLGGKGSGIGRRQDHHIIAATSHGHIGKRIPCGGACDSHGGLKRKPRRIGRPRNRDFIRPPRDKKPRSFDNHSQAADAGPADRRRKAPIKRIRAGLTWPSRGKVALVMVHCHAPNRPDSWSRVPLNPKQISGAAFLNASQNQQNIQKSFHRPIIHPAN